MVFLNIDELIYLLLFAVLFEVFSMGGFGGLRIKKASIVFVLAFGYDGVSGLATLFVFLEMASNHMLK
jgi:hypothetical protein